MTVFPTKPPTLAEIARTAGVSTATIARVLKSRGYVAEETRARVAAVLLDTSYRPNIVASGLRTQRSFSLGLIVPAITSNPFFVNVAHGVEEEGLQHGYKTIIFNHNGDELLEPRRARALAGGADHTLDPRADSVAEAVRELTGGRGADTVIEVSGAAPALNEAIRTVGYNGLVVAMSWYGGSFETLSLSGEFHHNRTRVVSSQVGAVNPDLGPLWSVGRRAEIAREYLDLLAPDLAGFVTHRLPLGEAQRGYNLLDQGDPDVMQVVFDYRLDS